MTPSVRRMSRLQGLISRLYYRAAYWMTFISIRWANALMIRGVRVQVGKRRF